MLRRVAIGVGVALVALLVLVGLVVFGIDTGPGRAFAARQLAGYTLTNGLNFRAAQIDGSLYGRMILRGVEVRDLKGLLATSPEVVVDWRPRAAFAGKVDIREALADEVRLLRMPSIHPSDPNEPLLPDIDIALGKLAIARLVIEKPVSGQQHIVRLAMSTDIADGRAKVAVDADAISAPGVAGGDRLVLRLDAVPADNKLVIDARLTAPAGGLADSFTKLGRPLDARIGGRGSWAVWQGDIRATAGGASLAGIALTGRNGVFTARGSVNPGIILTGPAQRLVEPGIDIDVTAALAERRVDLRAAAKSPAFTATATGLIDLADSRFGNLRVAAQLLKPGVIAPNLSGRDVRLDATLDGKFATPTLTYRVSGAALAFDATTLEGFFASGRATVDADRILVPITARAKRISGLNAAVGGLLTNIAIDGDLAWSKGQLLSDNLRLRSDRIAATAVVVADVAKGRYTGALKGRLNDYQVDGLGRVDLITDARLVTPRGGGFGLEGSVRALTRRIDNASVREQLGGNAVLTAKFGYVPGGAATVRDLRLNAPRLRIVEGGGSYRPDGRIAFAARATSAQYGPVTLDASGSVARPVVRLRAARPNVGVQLTDVDATLTGEGRGYRVRAKGGSPYGPFAADTLLSTGPVAVDIRSARFAGIDFRGRVRQTAAGPFAGEVSLNGSGLNGTVRLAAAGANQSADVDVRAVAARIPGDTPITIGSGTIRATAVMYPGAPAITADVTLADVRSGTFLVSRARSRVDYRGGNGSVQFTASGDANAPFDVRGQARLSPGRVVANLAGSLNRIAFSLAAPAVATRTGSEWRLQPVTLVVPQGRARLAGTYGRETTVQAVLDNLDLAIVEAFAPGLGLGGSVTGRVDARLPGGDALPIVDAKLNVAKFTRTAAYTQSDPIDVATQTSLSGEGGSFSAVARRGTAVIGRITARLAPLGAGASVTERLMAAPLSGGIRYNGPAEALWALGGIKGQQLSGPIVVAADFGGRLQQPTLNGVLRAAALRYENTAYGTVISNIALQGQFTQSRLELTSLTGKAGTGTLAARGTVGLDAAAGFPANVALTLDRAQLAKSDALGATVSGTLAVTNGPGGGLVKGDLTIPEARYQIIRQGAAEVTELAGVRRRSAVQAAAASNTPPPPPPSALRLDVRIRAANQIFVSGMGLEAEWATDMRVTGTATRPIVVGHLDIVRGTYSFAGRRFDLANDGRITFDGGPFTNPELALAASTTVEGVSATINIGGRAERPEITFTSTPALPQDEVLARLLFGGSVTSLSPTQAIQLAAALNSLRGSGGGLNPLGKLRSATGIDRLRVLGADQTTGRGTALAAGQYITRNIYVEVITDARGFTATQLEIALSKTLSLLSQTGSFGGSNASLRYSKDY